MRINEQVERLADIWAEASGRSKSRLATIVVNRGHFFESMRGKATYSIEAFEKFLSFFRNGDNWPEGHIPEQAVQLLDNFENIATEAAPSTRQIDEASPDPATGAAA